MDAVHLDYHAHDSDSQPIQGILNISLDYALEISQGSLPHKPEAFEARRALDERSSFPFQNYYQLKTQSTQKYVHEGDAQECLRTRPSLNNIYRHYKQARQHAPNTPTLSSSTAPSDASYREADAAWPTLAHDISFNNTAAIQPRSFSLHHQNICVSDCGSDEPCRSQCGDNSHGVCCDDDACGSPQLCLNESCQEASCACTDENCLAEAPAAQEHRSTAGRLEANAAAVLTSFGDGNQLQGLQDGFLNDPPEIPGVFCDGSMPFLDPSTSPYSFLSTDPVFASQQSSFPGLPLSTAFEYRLANHIMQHHDPLHGLAHSGHCAANDPSQLISHCTLLKPLPDGNASYAYLSQPPVHKCGFQIQDPNAFIQHIIRQHIPDSGHQTHLAASLQDPQVPTGGGALHQPPLQGLEDHMPVPMNHGQPFSPSPPPLVTSLLSSLSSTPSPTTVTSPVESEMGGTELGSAPAAIAHDPSSASTDFTCEWQLDGHGRTCGQRFRDYKRLQDHCKFHHLKLLKKTSEGFRCGWANCFRCRYFTQRSKLERHMQTHTGFKPVTCEICGTALSAKQALEQHMRIHTGETPWICKFPGCTCSFKQQSALTMHERTHTGDKPLKCDICRKRFSESSNLSKHRKTHNVRGTYECHLCGKDFHRLDQLRRHMGTSHKDRPDEVNAWMNRSQSKTKPPQTHKMTRPIEPSPSDDLKPRDTPPNSNPLKRKLQKRSR